LFGVDRGYAMTRKKNIFLEQALVKFLQSFPKAGRSILRSAAKKALPDGYDVDTHFNPPYKPWDQRLCVAPDGDFFKTIKDGKASVVTDHIDRVTEKGVLLESGEELEADVIVTATGLNLRFFGGIAQTVDGKPFELANSFTYRGLLLSGLPNWAVMVGYTKSSSWTLKIGLLCRYLCDLIRHLDATGDDFVVPVAEAGMESEPLLDLTAGYVQRSLDKAPKQGPSLPWRLLTSHHQDSKLLKGDLYDEHLTFGSRATASPSEAPAAAAGAQ
jgi:cation diffusion facilitator CzcD-associated flavoprotein CzcO